MIFFGVRGAVVMMCERLAVIVRMGSVFRGVSFFLASKEYGSVEL